MGHPRRERFDDGEGEAKSVGHPQGQHPDLVLVPLPGSWCRCDLSPIKIKHVKSLYWPEGFTNVRTWTWHSLAARGGC